MVAEEKIIALKSSNGKTFEMEKAVVMELQAIKRIVENDCVDKPIHLPKVASSILAKIIEYCRKHDEAGAKDCEGIDSKSVEEEVEKFDDAFVNEIEV